MYNAQVNYFAVVELVIEIPAEGALRRIGYLLPSSWVEAVRLIKYQGQDGDIIMTFEFLYIAFAIFSFLKNTISYISNVVNAFKTLPPKGGPIRKLLYILFGRFWDFVDFFVGILAICSVVAFFLRQQYIEQGTPSALISSVEPGIQSSSVYDARDDGRRIRWNKKSEEQEDLNTPRLSKEPHLHDI
ncbi:hypothetical protein ANCDUO_23042 [Ancylostoma duodenale]|uniref:Uncharacterized protein n=1 Tax=Ancylostoma duodenale TaxID=51022 RepID=A0A0C2CAQ9_9BILA|nr:hypothetical protein ANCDUO_23042 [Ancylostoma duodenale]